jgi:uncharacterized integral membrane protein
MRFAIIFHERPVYYPIEGGSLHASTMILNKRLVTFLLVCLPALWVAAISILSVQNATPVALQFLWFESVELPVGVVLSFCAAGAMVLTTGLLVALRSPSSR